MIMRWPRLVTPPRRTSRTPAVVLAEELITTYDGWLAGHESGSAEAEAETSCSPRPNMAPLPDAPRRFKNPPKSV
jgi:hypothetical protein